MRWHRSQGGSPTRSAPSHSQNGDRQDRDEAREQGRGAFRLGLPRRSEGLPTRIIETGSTARPRSYQITKQKASRRPFWQIAEAHP